VIFKRLTQIEAKITRFINQILVYVENEVVFAAHLRLHPGKSEGKFYVISLVIFNRTRKEKGQTECFFL